jgi:hypothetical protein
LKEFVTTSRVLRREILVGGCSGAFNGLGCLPSKVSYWLGWIAQEIKEIAFSDMRRN